jgi:WhiB family redox-sensing transcriptional regulator
MSLYLTNVIIPGWFVDALCAEIGGDEWYPEKGGTTRAAKRICAKCPVREECLEWALQNQERFGVWGGKSERERRAMTPREAA